MEHSEDPHGELGLVQRPKKVAYRPGGPRGIAALRALAPTRATAFLGRPASEGTRKQYERVLAAFALYLERRGKRGPGEVIPEDVIAYRDALQSRKLKPATIARHLSTVRTFFDYLVARGDLEQNPAAVRLVAPPEVSDELVGRALSDQEVMSLLSVPKRATAGILAQARRTRKPLHRDLVDGARDYALLLVLLRLGLRVSEACAIRRSSIRSSHGRWTIAIVVKGGKQRVLPLPADVKEAIDVYLEADRSRRLVSARGKDLADYLAGEVSRDAYVFQPHGHHRGEAADKGLSPQWVWVLVRRYARLAGIEGKLSPHDLRRTAITRALDLGLTYRQVQMMSGHKDPRTVERYDHGRENLELNAVNFLRYGEQRRDS